MNTWFATILLLLSQASLTWADDSVSVSLPECMAKLERRMVEPNVLIVRSECPLSLQSLSTLLDKGIQGLPGNQASPIAINLGRLMDYPEWSQDLARLAAKSSAWNARRGRPANADESVNQRIRLLLNRSAYSQHLESLFARHRVGASISEVEKVLVFKAKDFYLKPASIPKGIAAEARLPIDAQIWLRLEPLSKQAE